MGKEIHHETQFWANVQFDPITYLNEAKRCWKSVLPLGPFVDLPVVTT